ncbi:MAG TPA: hypothetical protein VFB81_18535 [Myxococcales bacterium]|nr:hypothetical protein [Myxococcales bacterium]
MSSGAAIVRLAALALLAVAGPARAQRAVVLEFDGDPGDRLRSQVIDTVVGAGKVALIPVRDFRQAAARKGFGGARAERREAIKAVARSLQLDVVVDAAVRGGEVRVVLFDPAGQELWSRDLPLRRGRLDDDTAKRLATAIAIAAVPPPGEPPPPPLRTIPDETPPVGPGPGTGTGARPPPPPRREPPPPPRAVEDALPPAFEELPRPDLVRFALSGHTIWRNYCARPAVRTCRQWALIEPRPVGETQDFISDIPYSGVLAELQLFPLSSVQNQWVNGIGLGGSYGAGFSMTRVRVSTPTSTTEERTVLSTDISFSAHAMYRVYFALPGPRFWCFAGARGGVQGRLFSVDPDAVVPVAGSHRAYGFAGVDLGIRFTPLWNVEGSVWYLHDPHAGQEDLVPFGTTVSGRGIGAELGVHGDVWGPVGYAVRGRFAGYGDVFRGPGLRWVDGGAAEELYLSVTWGAFVRY